MKSEKSNFVISIPIYKGVDLMDIAAPREIFGWMNSGGFEPTVEIYYVAETEEMVKTRDGTKILPDKTFHDPDVAHPDLIWVPGGSPSVLSDMLKDLNLPFFHYVTSAGENAPWVTSVCEGAVLLAATGLLNGYEITTHHAFIACMEAFPEVTVVPGYPRYVKSGNRVTGGGISSGLDEAFYLVELIAGTQVALSAQSTMQYYPDPPVMGEIVPSDTCPIPDFPT